MIRRLFDWIRPLLGIAILAGLLATPVLAFFARFGDGPLGPFPGGPLFGPIEEPPDGGWSFAAGLETMEVQVGADPTRSVLTGLIVHQGTLYAPVTLAPIKRWDEVVLEQPQVIVRIDGHLYERRAGMVYDPDWNEVLFEAGRRKYGGVFYGDWAADLTRFFRLDHP